METDIDLDLGAVKARQQGAWSVGRLRRRGHDAADRRREPVRGARPARGSSVLDVAAGNGNATLAAARRWCDVTSTDYVPALLESGRRRAQAEGHVVTFQQADAEKLPFADGSFDAVVSTFGVMFTPDQQQAARELARVCKPGGQIGLANWTPDSFVGQLFKLIGQYLPPAAGVKSPALWGTRERLDELFAGTRGADPGGEARVRVSLPLAAPLDRGLPHLLRPAQPDLRRARRGEAGGVHQRRARACWRKATGRPIACSRCRASTWRS